MSVSVVDTGPRQVSRSVQVAAAPDQLFALVADPHRHGELDGSGTVNETVSGPTRLSEGAKFSVKMKQFGLPYRITSKVTSFEEGSVVEWQHPLGHRWRWTFVPTGTGPATTTTVTETFDYSQINGVQATLLEATGMVRRNAVGIEKTLQKLAERY